MSARLAWFGSIAVCAGCAVALVVGGCGGSSSGSDAAWTVRVPAGWHETRFADSDGGIVASGVLISNVSLGKPSLTPGYPIQVNDRVLPARGIGLIIATDHDPNVSVRSGPLPLSSPNSSGRWIFGSALAGQPYLEIAGFHADGESFIATIKIGAHASRVASRALQRIVASIRQTG